MLNFSKMIRTLAQYDLPKAANYCAMLFTLSIWVLSIISLLFAAMIFVSIVWAYIPKEDGTLSRYCVRKVNQRLHEIVASDTRQTDTKDADLCSGDDGSVTIR